MICVYAASHVPALMFIEIEGHPILLIAFLVFVVQVSDVLQYVFGKLFGKRKIAPTLSPAKTWEGLVGGALSASLLGAALWWITPFTPLQAWLMSLLVTMLGFLGGLVMSAIKRDKGVKDWGHLIPGHGGFIDRLGLGCLRGAGIFPFDTILLVGELNSIFRSKVLHATAGFFLMGSWAAYANSEYQMPAPLVAGIVQGTLTASITLLLKRIVELVSTCVTGPARLFLSPLATGVVSLLILTAVHKIAGTAEIVTTISFPVMVSVSYAAIYAGALGGNGA